MVFMFSQLSGRRGLCPSPQSGLRVTWTDCEVFVSTAHMCQTQLLVWDAKAKPVLTNNSYPFAAEL